MPATKQPAEKPAQEFAHTRFLRQEDFVPPDSLERKKVTVIGVGAIGRQVALQLASIGCPEITLIDFDTVSETNVTTQGFKKGDIGLEKVTAVAQSIKEIDPKITVNEFCERCRPKHKLTGTVFLCVDSIDARNMIWEWFKDKVDILIDGRMLGENWRVLVAKDKESKEHYAKSLFPPSEQIQGRCTAHATIYSASMPASWMVHQFTRFLRNLCIDQDMSCNMLAGEFLPIT